MKLTESIMQELKELESSTSEYGQGHYYVLHSPDYDKVLAAIKKVLAEQPETGVLTDEQWEALCHDISDRRGLKREWNQIDDEVKLDIRKAWSILLSQRPASEPPVPYSEAFARKMAGPAPKEPAAPVSNPVPGTSAFPSSEARDNDFDVPQAAPTNAHPDDAVVEEMQHEYIIGAKSHGICDKNGSCCSVGMRRALGVARREMYTTEEVGKAFRRTLYEGPKDERISFGKFLERFMVSLTAPPKPNTPQERMEEILHRGELMDALGMQLADANARADTNLTELNRIALLLADARKLLNPVCPEETLCGAIRNLQQVALTATENSDTAYKQLADARKAVEWVPIDEEHLPTDGDEVLHFDGSVLAVSVKWEWEPDGGRDANAYLDNGYEHHRPINPPAKEAKG